jgi:large subunit ribosomal protein L19
VNSELIDSVEKKSLKPQLPYFEVGDTVDVHCKIKEGDKSRVQIFSGTVISKKGRGLNQQFTVRRMIGDEGVERTFPINSPSVADVKPVRSGKTRRAKLYYLRERTGKAVKLSQKRTDHTTGKSGK